MSELSQDEIKRAMAEALKESGRDLNLDSKDIDKVLEGLLKLDKQVKSNTTTMGGLFKEMVTGRKVYKDLNSELQKLDEAIEDLADSADEASDEIRLELMQRRNSVQLMAQHNTAQRAAIEGLTTFSKTVTGIAGRSMGGLVKGLQDGSSAFQLAGGLMEGAIDTANAGMQTVGAGMGAVGTTMMTSTNPRVKALGLVATVASIGITKMADAAAGLAKFVVGYMIKEMDKTVEAFNKSSTAGAMFADGMTGMRNNAHLAGLTVKQFSDVLEKNSTLFGESGLGVANGAKQMGRVGKVLRETGMTDQLLKLGYGFEEQAELIAETTANMRRTAGGKIGDKEVAEQTAKYAENLRLIASITGEDAKKKVKQVEEENQILAFQQKLAGKSTEQRAQIDAAMATMTDQERKNFRDRVVLGNVINEEGAIYEGTVKGAREKGQAALDLFNNNQLTAEANADLNVQYGKVIKESIMSQDGIATAGMVLGGQVGAVSKAMLDSVNQINTYTDDAKKVAKTSIEGQKTATDDLTKNTVLAAKAAQQLAIDLENVVLHNLGQFAKFSGEILNELQKQLASLGLSMGPGGTKGAPTGSKGFDWGAVGSKALEYGGYGMVAGSMIPGLGTAAGGVAAAIGGAGKSIIDQMASGSTFGSERSGTPMQLTDMIQFGGGTGDMQHFQLLDPEVQIQFIQMAQEYFQATGKKLQINSAFRSTAEQAAVDSGGNPKAKPGNSLHEVGRALDLNSSDVSRLTQMGLLGKYGFSPLDKDPPHIQMLAKGGITNGTSIAGEAGPEAVVPLPDGRTIPVKMDTGELVDAIRELIAIAKDHRDNSEKLLWAQS